MKSVHKRYLDMIERLKKLGLNNYESRAYLVLLRLGNAVADEIAIEARIPMGRIYDVLSNLESARLVIIQATRPKKYLPVEPAISLKRLSVNKLNELNDRMAEKENLVNDLMSEISGIRERKSSRMYD